MSKTLHNIDIHIHQNLYRRNPTGHWAELSPVTYGFPQAQIASPARVTRALAWLVSTVTFVPCDPRCCPGQSIVLRGIWGRSE